MNNPIHKVLSTMRDCRVRCLLMGGQACILYGGAEFSRDVDLAVMASAGNIDRLRQAIDSLQAEVIAVPPFDERHLARGHAIHFRSGHPDALNLRIDVMSVLRGVEPFEILWERRTTIDLAPGLTADVLSLPDLVKAKKTQRDKDWPMIRRLVEADYARYGQEAGTQQVQFWLLECRTPGILVELVATHGRLAQEMESRRPLLAMARAGNMMELERALAAEEWAERQSDRQHWEPLRRELESLRHASRR